MINKAGNSLGGVLGNYSGRGADKVERNRAQVSSDSSGKVASSGAANKMDTIEISRRPSNGDPVLSDIKHKIIEDINKDTDPAILKDLKEKYDSGEYRADPDEIARILLENL